MDIYGAGIAGLLAGCAFQDATIFEANALEDVAGHKALLRFRTPDVGTFTGIEFRKVRVHKGIWSDNEFVDPTIYLSNCYSRKVIGRLADRSIWNLAPCDRWVAPECFVDRLIERCLKRIKWQHPVTTENALNNVGRGAQVISTLPLNIIMRILDVDERTAMPKFDYAPITVRRWRVPHCDVFQTVYFPDLNTSLYRASITGNMLIAEYATDFATTCELDAHNDPFKPFAIHEDECEPLVSNVQRFGKIAPLESEHWRRQAILRLTEDYGVFSLGRFATWRNLLLDDVLADISVIKKLVNSGTYDRRLFSASKTL